jgi:hypothetical protein
MAFADGHPAEPRTYNWSVGAGVGSAGTLVSLTPIESGQTPPTLPSANSPSASLLAERRLGQATWLLLKVSVGYGQSTGSPLITVNGLLATGSLKESSTTLAAAVGVRQLALASGPVQLSWFALSGVGAEWTNSAATTNTMQTVFPGEVNNGSTETLTTSAQATSLSVFYGVAIDVALMENLFVRLDAPLVNFVYAWETSKQTSNSPALPATPTTSGQGFSIGFLFSPALELRLAF